MPIKPLDIPVLISEEKIQQRVRLLGKQITEDLQKYSEDVVALCVLNGAYIFFSDLIRLIDRELHFDFISVSSYHKSKSLGRVQLNLNFQEPLEGKQVLLVEDILDTGCTMSYLQKKILSSKPKRLVTVVLLKKIKTLSNEKVTPSEDDFSCTVDYTGFEFKGNFVVGYGMDYEGRFRNLPYIGELVNQP